DNTGELSRVADLVEAGRPKQRSILADLRALMSFGYFMIGSRRLVITPVRVIESYDEMIPQWF
ncbi:hypothetical protein, partial [Klebsiella pneumoniae]|uniref:hypothetical protein n=1 Tax=Klebsiella pneumoniae TaxID=573 RepID=UPI003CCA995A